VLCDARAFAAASRHPQIVLDHRRQARLRHLHGYPRRGFGRGMSAPLDDVVSISVMACARMRWVSPISVTT
jgi:hypothetical protein